MKKMKGIIFAGGICMMFIEVILHVVDDLLENKLKTILEGCET